MTIRLLVPDDFEIFKRIRLEALRTAPEAFASRASDWEKLPDEEWRRRIENNTVVVCFRQQEPIGIMGLTRQQAGKMAHRATLNMVYLRQDGRSGGQAAAMLDMLVQHAKAVGISQIELAVTAGNPAAVRFYRREGFHEIGRIPAGFLHEGREIDEIMMVRRIT